MDNKTYFYEALGRSVSGTVYQKYGGVALTIATNKEETIVGITVYNISQNMLNSIGESDKKEHIKFEKQYDMSPVDFSQKDTVYRCLADIVQDLEIQFFQTIESMRISAEVRNGGLTESGMVLIDKEGNSYHWITKHYGHPLFFTDDWVMVRMTIKDDIWGTGKDAKNVRLVKDSQSEV